MWKISPRRTITSGSDKRSLMNNQFIKYTQIIGFTFADRFRRCPFKVTVSSKYRDILFFKGLGGEALLKNGQNPLIWLVHNGRGKVRLISLVETDPITLSGNMKFKEATLLVEFSDRDSALMFKLTHGGS